MNHIELFAGCGGLSLGLHAAGFELLLANELSPMASESFAYNFFNEDFEALADNNQMPVNALWLSSNYSNLKPRLRENPFTYPSINNGYSELPKEHHKLKGKLLVGSISELNKLLISNVELAKVLSEGFDHGTDLDLVSGGPPCQSFSMAGLRNKDCDKNTLPWEFAKFVSIVRPKIAMLENVTGILRAFKDTDGNSYHAWYEVAKAFASVGYVPVCLHINAKYAGVPQNRPRFIMISLRTDFFEKVLAYYSSDQSTYAILSQSIDFYEKVKVKGTSLEFGFLNIFDASKPLHRDLIKSSFLSGLVDSDLVSVRNALDDLKLTKPALQSSYVKENNDLFSFLPQRDALNNHHPRVNGDVVRRRFRIYQTLQRIDDTSVTKDVFAVLKGNADHLSDSTWIKCSKYDYLHADNSLRGFDAKKDFVDYLKLHPTKKQTQKALNADAPAPAALSIPDDACHYDDNELRVLTVREMARIQSFPDNFVFRSKVTTGGQMRKFEVPQYTQVGNAVPPLLGFKLGCCISKLLKVC